MRTSPRGKSPMSIVAGLAAKTGVEERAMLYTKREWKKVSMKYFQES